MNCPNYIVYLNRTVTYQFFNFEHKGRKKILLRNEYKII